MTEFLLPYQFIPLNRYPNTRLSVRELVHSPDMAFRHDVWCETAHSGRIVCSLTLETPLLVAQASPDQKEEQMEKSGHTYPVKRMYARAFGQNESAFYLAGNSLRGMISALAECLSNSALRVQKNEPLSLSVNRKRESFGNLYDYIPEPVLPLGEVKRSVKSHKGSKISATELTTSDFEETLLTPAELLFGFVPTQKPKEAQSSTGFASRVRFSDARHLPTDNEEHLSEANIIRELATPKTASHNMKFHTRGSKKQGIKKGELNARDHEHNGRVFYLHPTQTMIDQHWWIERKEIVKRQEHRYAGRPMKQGETFAFHVDFNNLDDEELDLLLCSLRPHENFRHKLGMGKPLGLGSVRIDVQGVFFTHYARRYEEHGFNRSSDAPINLHADHRRVAGMQASNRVRQHYASMFARNAEKLDRLSSNRLIKLQNLEVLKTIGQWPNPTNAEYVSYPYIDNPGDTGFEWYTQNDKKNNPQHLHPVIPNQPLPTLKTR